MRVAEAPRQAPSLNVREALHAICSTGKGRCWFCDRRLPSAREAVRAGWDVQRIEGQRVATIIIICPRCQHSSDGLDLCAPLTVPM